MNKKIIFTLFVLLACFSLVGCKDNANVDVIHIHEWSGWTEVEKATCTKGGVNERTCKTCEEVEKINTNKAAHNFVEVSKTEATDCSTDSKVTYECSVCKEQKVITIPATGHTVVIDKEVAPTCTEDGLTEGSHCSTCAKVLTEQKEIKALGHAWGELIISKDSPNTGKYVCSVCNTTKTVELSGHTHTVTVTDNKEATCTKGGLSGVGVCDDCGKVVFDNVTINPLGHNYVDGKCIRCKEVEAEDGMKFLLQDDGYYLEDIGTIKGHTVNIPIMYNNQYVVGLLDGAFDKAEYAYTICLPYTIKTIEAGAFEKCKMLQNIIVDPRNEYFESIENCLVDSATKTLLVGGANAIIPEGIVNIAENAYKNHVGVTYIKIPASVESIGKNAFDGCLNILLIEVDSNNKVYYSKDNCLIDAETEVLLLGCRSSIIPEGTVIIGEGAFAGCELLTEIKIPTSVTTIMPGAFSGCNFVTKLEISASVTELTGAFEGLKNLSTITIDENNPRYTVVDNCIMEKKTNTLVLSNSNAVIPEGTVIIGEGAFAGNTNITSIVIPEGVTIIGERAFADCVALESLTLTKGVVTIEKEAFSNCIKLESFIIPRGITTIGDYAFEGCEKIVRLDIPTSVTTIGEGAFKGCKLVIICGEAKAKPEGWHVNYNPDGRPEFWNIYIMKD